MHEKLTELIMKLDVHNCDECFKCCDYVYGDCDDRCFSEKVAEYLIKNGVTILEV